METDKLSIQRIERIVKLRDMKAKISREERCASSPILSDFSLIDGIYDIFKSHTTIARSVVMTRKEFIFIVVYLYSPSVLAGGKMGNGLREKIGDVLGIYGKSVISDNVSGLMVTYNIYKYFRDDIDAIFPDVMNWLRSVEAIK